jgi:hypothetical protein
MNNGGSEDLWLSATCAVVNGGRWLRGIKRRPGSFVPNRFIICGVGNQTAAIPGPDQVDAELQLRKAAFGIGPYGPHPTES